MDVRTLNRSKSRIQIVGHELGYEDGYYPGTYDVLTAGDHSPLLNAFEVTERSGMSEPVDVARGLGPQSSDHLARRITDMARRQTDPSALRAEMADLAPNLLSWRIKDAPVAKVDSALRGA